MLHTKHASIFGKQFRDYSGPGSTIEYTEPYRVFLTNFIKSNNINDVLDIGCGDLRFISKVDFGNIKYLGIDCIPELVKRNKLKYPTIPCECVDISTSDIPGA